MKNVTLEAFAEQNGIFFYEKHAKDVTGGLFLQYHKCERRIPEGVYIKKGSELWAPKIIDHAPESKIISYIPAQSNHANELFI